jgi:hypothetical protein
VSVEPTTSADAADVLERRDRPGHAVAIEIRRDGNTRSPTPVRCRVCGASLDVLAGGKSLTDHLLGSDECREAIRSWLGARRERRFSPDRAE